MATYQAYKAIEDALETGKALLKFISANDVNATGAHQAGYYLPKGAWEMFAPFGPVKGRNDKVDVDILWPDGRHTDSVITWYGQGTRSEYRLTRFGNDFPWQSPDSVGNLLVVIPTNLGHFVAHVLDLEEDFDEIQIALGLDITQGWSVYDSSRGGAIVQDPTDCINGEFRRFSGGLTAFPAGAAFSTAARQALEKCLKDFGRKSLDEQLVKLTESEYQLFKMAERQIVQHDIIRTFKSVDDFLETASSIMNRRKSRAGQSLEHHVQSIFTAAGLQYDAQAKIEGEKKPDLLFPGKAAYEDASFPTEKLRLMGVKTTCKDRWRQVLNEGSRVAAKHILTLQSGISSKQLTEMSVAGVTLVVPTSLHKEYPAAQRSQILSVEQFVTEVKAIQV